jgi:hypothetical protein
MLGCFGNLVVTTLVWLSTLFCPPDCGCIVRPAFPAPSDFFKGRTLSKPRAKTRGEIAELCLPSLRGARLSAEARFRAKADATKQSTLSSSPFYGLFRKRSQ